eukprot:7282971-Prymnesium_polylepis.1
MRASVSAPDARAPRSQVTGFVPPWDRQYSYTGGIGFTVLPSLPPLLPPSTPPRPPGRPPAPPAPPCPPAPPQRP